MTNNSLQYQRTEMQIIVKSIISAILHVWKMIVAVIALIVVVAALVAPVLQHYLGYPAGEGTYKYLGEICHQYPSRSLWIFARPIGLCARCFAAYLGIFITVIIYRPQHLTRGRFFLGAILLGCAILDPVIQLRTDYLSTNITRIITGLLGGVAIALLATPTFKTTLQKEMDL